MQCIIVTNHYTATTTIFCEPTVFLYSLRSPNTGGACYSSCIFWKWPVPSPTAEATSTGVSELFTFRVMHLCSHTDCTKKTPIIYIWFPEGEESRERRRVWEVGGQVPLVMVSVRSQYCTLPLLISTVQQGQLLWKHCCTVADPAPSVVVVVSEPCCSTRDTRTLSWACDGTVFGGKNNNNNKKNPTVTS